MLALKLLVNFNDTVQGYFVHFKNYHNTLIFYYINDLVNSSITSTDPVSYKSIFNMLRKHF